MTLDPNYQVVNYEEQGGARQVIGGELNIAAGGRLTIDGGENVISFYARVSAADINAGKVLILGVAGRTIRVTGFRLRAIGGAAGGSTSVDITDTAGTPVNICSALVAALTQNTLVGDQSANVTIGAGYLVGLTADKGVQIGKTGGALSGATSVDVLITYTIL